MHAAVAGDDFLPIDREGASVEVGHFAACLHDHERAGRGVPRVQFQLPKAIESAGRNVAQVQGRRSGPADALRAEREPGEMVQVILLAFSNVVGEASDQQGSVQQGR